MIRNSLKSESGYSLVEVMAAIIILTVAIIPMVTMFDAGLRTAILGSNYDKARALANKQLEMAQTLPYSTVSNDFPNAPCTFDGNGLCEAIGLEDPDSEFSNFRYTIQKQHIKPDDNDDPSSFSNSSTQTGYMRITVEIGWGGASFDGNEYTTTALKTR